MDFAKEKVYIPSQTAIYDKRLLVIAGVEGAGKSSAAGIWRHFDKEILETTLTEDELAFIRLKKEQGYYIKLAYIGLESLDEHLSRIKNRVRKGGPFVKPETVRAQYDHRWEALNKVLPLCDEAAFYDNENGFRCVGRCCSHVMEISQKPCRWFQEFLERTEATYDLLCRD